MKKTMLLLCVFSLFVGCNDEPIDGEFGNPDGSTNSNGNGQSGNSSTLNSYSLETKSTVPIFGEIITKSTFVFNNDNVVSEVRTDITAFGSTQSDISTYTRDTSGNITKVESSENVTTITYTENKITEIQFDDLIDNDEDYTYTFVHNGNVVTRTSNSDNAEVVFTFNNQNRLISKVSTESGSTIFSETLSYDANGNCSNSNITGDENYETVFGFDAFNSPLYDLFKDQEFAAILDSEYDEAVSPTIVQFNSKNNWTSISSQGTTVDFMVNYNAQNNITSRSGTYNLGDGVVIEQSEIFAYN